MRVAQLLLSCLWLASACVCCYAQGQPSDEQVVKIPFDFYRSEIILQVNVNAKGPFNMLLDTGIDPSVVDLVTARVLGLKLQALNKPASGGGTEAALIYQTRLPVVQVGGLTVNTDLIPSEKIEKAIYLIRGEKVMLDRDWQNSMKCRLERSTRQCGAIASAFLETSCFS